MALLVLTLWIPHLGQSFWLDETGTYWIISGSFEEAWERSLHFQVQSPLYFVVLWVVERVARGSEVLLRMPSVLAALVATIGVSELAQRLIGRVAKWVAPAVFVALPYVATAALDARPYAPAIASLVWSGVFLLRWLASGSQVHLSLFVVATGLTAAFHIAFLLPVSILLIFGIMHCAPLRRGRFVLAVLAVVALCVPSLVAAVATLGSPNDLSVPLEASLSSLGVAIWPPILVVAAAAALLFGGRPTTTGIPLHSEYGLGASYLLISCWLVVPSFFLWSLSTFTPLTVFAPRYLSMSGPAVALAAAAGLAALWDGRDRERAVVAFVVILLGGAWSAAGVEGWRDASAATNALVAGKHSLVFVQAGYIESDSPDYFENDTRRAWLMAPLSRYPVEGDVVPVPYDLDEFGEAYLLREARAASAYEQVVLLTRRPESGVALFLDHELPVHSLTSENCFDGVCVAEFLRGSG